MKETPNLDVEEKEPSLHCPVCYQYHSAETEVCPNTGERITPEKLEELEREKNQARMGNELADVAEERARDRERKKRQKKIRKRKKKEAKKKEQK